VIHHPQAVHADSSAAVAIRYFGLISSYRERADADADFMDASKFVSG
jgi:hypothetical protein